MDKLSQFVIDLYRQPAETSTPAANWVEPTAIEKRAYSAVFDSLNRDSDFLAKFEGTPLAPQAIALAERELAAEQRRLQRRLQRMASDSWEQDSIEQDQLQLQKQQLLLQLYKMKAVTPPPQPGDAAIGQPDPAQMQQESGAPEEKVAFSNPYTAGAALGAGIGAVGGGLAGAQKAGPGNRMSGALRGAAAGGAVGALGGAALGHGAREGARQVAAFHGMPKMQQQVAARAAQNMTTADKAFMLGGLGVATGGGLAAGYAANRGTQKQANLLTPALYGVGGSLAGGLVGAATGAATADPDDRVRGAIRGGIAGGTVGGLGGAGVGLGAGMLQRQFLRETEQLMSSPGALMNPNLVDEMARRAETVRSRYNALKWGVGGGAAGGAGAAGYLVNRNHSQPGSEIGGGDTGSFPAQEPTPKLSALPHIDDVLHTPRATRGDVPSEDHLLEMGGNPYLPHAARKAILDSYLQERASGTTASPEEVMQQHIEDTRLDNQTKGFLLGGALAGPIIGGGLGLAAGHALKSPDRAGAAALGAILGMPVGALGGAYLGGKRSITPMAPEEAQKHIDKANLHREMYPRLMRDNAAKEHLLHQLTAQHYQDAVEAAHARAREAEDRYYSNRGKYSSEQKQAAIHGYARALRKQTSW